MEPETIVTAPEPSQPEPSGFATRAANVFSSPTELFTEVGALPVQASSWALPLIISVIVTALVTFMIFNNATLRDQIQEQQRVEIQKMVDNGKLTQDQANQALERMGGGSVIEIVIATISGAVVAAIIFFVIPLVLWLGAKFGLKFGGTYKKVLEVYGLASLIAVLGSIVAVLMMYSLNTMYATPGGSLLVMNNFDRHNIAHNLLASLNIFTLWMTAVTGIGLAKISGKSIGAGLIVVFLLWAVWTIIASLMGWGFR